MGAKTGAQWGSWANIQAVQEENTGSMGTGEEGEMVVTRTQFCQITPHPGDSLDPPVSPIPLLVNSVCLKSRGFGRQVPSSGPKINKGMAVLWPNNVEQFKEFKPLALSSDIPTME